MLELTATVSDDPLFLDLAARLIGGAAGASGFGRLVVTHLDHWFGPRWLGFCGKMLGVAGVRSRRLTGNLTPPSFHPHRIQSVRGYEKAASGAFVYRGNVNWLHGHRTSEENINRTFHRGRAYAWYSGGTVQADKGVVMVYLVEDQWSTAWYAGFDKWPAWHLAVTRSIAPARVHELLAWSLSGKRRGELFS